MGDAAAPDSSGAPSLDGEAMDSSGLGTVVAQLGGVSSELEFDTTLWGSANFSWLAYTEVDIEVVLLCNANTAAAVPDMMGAELLLLVLVVVVDG